MSYFYLPDAYDRWAQHERDEAFKEKEEQNPCEYCVGRHCRECEYAWDYYSDLDMDWRM